MFETSQVPSVRVDARNATFYFAALRKYIIPIFQH